MSCEDFRPLITKCPAVGCLTKEDVHWKHANCETKVMLNSEGVVRCPNCPFEWRLLQSNWACTKHVGDYRKTDQGSMASSLFIAYQVGGKAEQAWYGKLLQSVSQEGFTQTTNLTA